MANLNSEHIDDVYKLFVCCVCVLLLFSNEVGLDDDSVCAGIHYTIHIIIIIDSPVVHMDK